MARVALLKPNMSGESSFASTSGIDDSGVKKFYMNVQSMAISVGTQVAELTGDGDTVRHFQHNQMQNGQFSMRGYMVTEYAVGVANINSQSNNPFDIAVAVGRTGSAIRYFVFRAIVSQIQVGWALDGPFSSIQIAGLMTDTYLTTSQTEMFVETGTVSS